MQIPTVFHSSLVQTIVDKFVDGNWRAPKNTQPKYYTKDSKYVTYPDQEYYGTLVKKISRLIKLVDDEINIALVRGKHISRKLTQWVKVATALKCKVADTLNEVQSSKSSDQKLEHLRIQIFNHLKHCPVESNYDEPITSIAGLHKIEDNNKSCSEPELLISENVRSSESLEDGESSRVFDDDIPEIQTDERFEITEEDEAKVPEISYERSTPPSPCIEEIYESDEEIREEDQENLVMEIPRRPKKKKPVSVGDNNGLDNESELDMSVQNPAELRFDISSSSSSKEVRNWNVVVDIHLILNSDRDNYTFYTMNNGITQPAEYLTVNRGGGSSNDMPTDDEWSQAGEVNLSGKSSLLLNEEPPDCPNLVLLLLQRNNSLSRIPSSFFDRMPALRLLDLSCTRISALPTSLFKLRELKVLMLRSCVCLESLPPEVKNLSNMRALDLSSTDLYYLPNEIGQLTLLKHLQLSFYGPDYGSGYASLPSEILSPSIFSEMKDLEALSIVVHPEDQRWIKIADEIIKCVRLLENLSDLQFYFPTVDALDSFVEASPSWKKHKVWRFKFVVGNNVKRIISRVPDEVESKYDRLDQCLRFINGSQEVPQVMKRVVKSVKAFYLDHHLDIQDLSEFGICNFKQLEFCVVRECPNFQVMMIGESDVESAFPNLEHLEMHYLWELERIWEDPVPPGSFTALRYLIVDTCPKLKYIASQSMLQSLSNLDTLIIEDCESLKSIVKENKWPVKSHEATLLPRLTKLVLRHLPLLATLGSGLSPSDKIISHHFCPNLIMTPHPTTSKQWKFLGS